MSVSRAFRRKHGTKETQELSSEIMIWRLVVANGKARTVMIELAWLWLRHQPDSPLSVWFRERIGKLKGRIRRITIVAVARKLLIALWRYLETGLVAKGALLKV